MAKSEGHIAALQRAISRDHGFATLSALAVISILAALSYLLVDLTYAVKRTSSVNLITAQGRAIADGAITRTIAKIGAGKHTFVYGGKQTGRIDADPGWSGNLVVETELAKVDLNLATHQNLVDLLQFNQVPADRATRLADQILDWRDADSLRRLNGAEATEYEALGLDYAPRNGPFERIQELKLIPGMPDDLIDKLDRQVTVYSGNFNATQAAIREIISGEERPITLPRPQGFAYTIRAKAVHRSGIVVSRLAVIRLTTNPDTPFLVYVWEDE